jgi:hypothetical protein
MSYHCEQAPVFGGVKAFPRRSFEEHGRTVKGPIAVGLTARLPAASTRSIVGLIVATPVRGCRISDLRSSRRRCKDKFATSRLVMPLHIHVMLPALPHDDSDGDSFSSDDHVRGTFSEIIVYRLYDVREAFT